VKSSILGSAAPSHPKDRVEQSAFDTIRHLVHTQARPHTNANLSLIYERHHRCTSTRRFLLRHLVAITLRLAHVLHRFTSSCLWGGVSLCEKHTDQTLGSRAWRGHTLANVLHNAQSKRDMIRPIKPMPHTPRFVCSSARTCSSDKAARCTAVHALMRRISWSCARAFRTTPSGTGFQGSHKLSIK
jgi:hypothetical protein